MNILPLLFGAGAGFGVLMLARGLRPGVPAPRPHRWRAHLDPRPGLAALGGGAVAYVLTGWPVLGLLTAVATLTVPRAMSNARQRAVTDRSEAVARWVEMLRDTMAGAAGLEEAVAITARRPPPAIRAPVEHLARRLHHQPLVTALHGFAAEVHDPGAQLLVAALITAATNETRDLGRLLSALAEATRAQVHMRRSIDAGRAHVRSATRLVLAVTVVFTVALFAFSREYLAPYASVEGQLWLGIVGIAFFGALTLLVRLDRSALPEQHLIGVPPGDATRAPA